MYVNSPARARGLWWNGMRVEERKKIRVCNPTKDRERRLIQFQMGSTFFLILIFLLLELAAARAIAGWADDKIEITLTLIHHGRGWRFDLRDSCQSLFPSSPLHLFRVVGVTALFPNFAAHYLRG